MSDDQPVIGRTRTAEIVRKSLPNPNRPRLSTETEAKLRDVDQRDAVCYAQAEELTAQLYDLASSLKSEDAVPVATDVWEDTSTVQHMVDAQERATGEMEPLARPASGSSASRP